MIQKYRRTLKCKDLFSLLSAMVQKEMEELFLFLSIITIWSQCSYALLEAKTFSQVNISLASRGCPYGTGAVQFRAQREQWGSC